MINITPTNETILGEVESFAAFQYITEITVTNETVIMDIPIPIILIPNVSTGKLNTTITLSQIFNIKKNIIIGNITPAYANDYINTDKTAWTISYTINDVIEVLNLSSNGTFTLPSNIGTFDLHIPVISVTDITGIPFQTEYSILGGAITTTDITNNDRNYNTTTVSPDSIIGNHIIIDILCSIGENFNYIDFMTFTMTGDNLNKKIYINGNTPWLGLFFYNGTHVEKGESNKTQTPMVEMLYIIPNNKELYFIEKGENTNNGFLLKLNIEVILKDLNTNTLKSVIYNLYIWVGKNFWNSVNYSHLSDWVKDYFENRY